ncbi:AGL083Wp [Eremothecium gossypii ATCC 10895]|uniref:Glucose transport transcription regulator RGT1 n=1 Tax=Eremothecium gossypii (strain ATCC 10895 / CBS 109.51 / FGSC 9923 / NRRL Y-1056) TaxID=284811 RepID=RGT1_EREGS|nr:AGL083Wp [Eremothecium gossypii ATCC 10895]Q750N3.1 RecName: Full=Glucose transport transcription regulator RGT1; AltName: Full=Restores glucose transport protein 1 [Eremothecium gossypii ATCC 10895]AAS54407.1 AGL083Wp [Eremothecium gossypii ATCC 10895]AEY98735.1 FAGL083Wp [Eremothecium gossypii FDAG1]
MNGATATATAAVGAEEEGGAREGSRRRDSVESAGDGRRRTKVSRACDQCRRKKIKCEYQEDAQSCSGCRKNSERCAFERVPLKRGPSKGYTRGEGAGDGARETEGARGELDTSRADGKAAPVSLPPLHYYLPISNGQPGGAPAQAPAAPFPPMKQQFWKVPYYENQMQRRSSLESVNSDASGPQSQQETYAASSASTSSHQRTSRSYFPSSDGASALFQEPCSSSYPPPLVRSSSTGGQLQQLPAPQYPYSQFAVALSGSTSASSQSVQLRTSATGSTSLPEDSSPSSSNAYSPQLRAHCMSESLTTPTAGSKTGGSVKRRKRLSEPADPIVPLSAREPRQAGHIGLPLQAQQATGKTGVICGKLSDAELIDAYYEYVHVNYPIIPINKETLTNEILLVNTQPISEVHEMNNYILYWFRVALELLLHVASDKTNQDTASGMDSNAVHDGGLYAHRGDFKQNEEHHVPHQSQLLAALNDCFRKLLDIHPKICAYQESTSPKVTTIYLSTYIIINYMLAMLGEDNTFVLGTSVTVFNEFKIYRLLVLHEVADEPGDDSADVERHGFELLYKRLYYSLLVFDALQSCCFGAPRLASLPISHLVEPLFAPPPPLDSAKWAVESDAARREPLLASIRLGALLTELCETRVLAGALPRAPTPALRAPRPFRVAPPADDSVPGAFFHALAAQRALLDRLLAIPAHPAFAADAPPDATVDLCAQLGDAICRFTSCVLDTLVRAGPRPASPFAAALSRALHHAINLSRNIPTSLIGCIIGTAVHHSRDRDLIVALSRCMSDMIQIQGLTHCLRPCAPPRPRARVSCDLRRLYGHDGPPASPHQVMLHQFIDIAWRLLRNDELGWF